MFSELGPKTSPSLGVGKGSKLAEGLNLCNRWRGRAVLPSEIRARKGSTRSPR